MKFTIPLISPGRFPSLPSHSLEMKAFPPHFTIFSLLILALSLLSFSTADSRTYIWPFPSEFTSGIDTLTVDPNLSISFSDDSSIVTDAFGRYKRTIFKHSASTISPSIQSRKHRLRASPPYDLSVLQVIVHSGSEELQLGVDESYTLLVERRDGRSIVGGATVEANTIYGALRGLETFSQLCAFDYGSKFDK